MVETIESHTFGTNGAVNAGGSDWEGQTFTIGTTGENVKWDVSRVRLRVYREGSPGTITVAIRQADGTGSDLSSGTFNGNDLTTSLSGEVKTVSLSSYTLEPSTQYMLIVRAPSGGVSDDLIHIMIDNTGYSGGSLYDSGDSGSSWSGHVAGFDWYFVLEGDKAITGQINIGDSWKDLAGVQINIGDSWKAVLGIQINIGDSWKTAF